MNYARPTDARFIHKVFLTVQKFSPLCDFLRDELGLSELVFSKNGNARTVSISDASNIELLAFAKIAHLEISLNFDQQEKLLEIISQIED
ncbi:MAG: hypothetical protein PHX25_02160 [Candidatus Pacebacteria bacterium]|nr:hypothetical protein [Candidatus Paceibacterota bacterium]